MSPKGIYDHGGPSEKIIKQILKHRIRGYSLRTIGKMFHYSRQRIHQIIKENKHEPKFKNLYKEIELTQSFLRRKIE